MPNRPTALLGTVAACATVLTVALSAGLTPAANAAGAPAPEWLRQPVGYSTQQLQFRVTVGPPGATEVCDVEGVLRVPAGVDAAHPAPAILSSNGFGGNESDTGAAGATASYAMQYAAQGYVTLSYSGLGFGQSTCQIELDSPAYDGKAGAALVDLLGGDLSTAFTTFTKDPTGVMPGTWSGPVTTAPPVQLDHVDHDGHASTHDPRVGMIGGSYGGENQFAVADVSPKVDTIVPQITWNDLVYSLAPNNLGTPGVGTTDPVTQTDAAPGVEKIGWVSVFFADGNLQPVGGIPGAGVPQPKGGAVTQTDCPDFDSRACAAYAQMDALGYPDPTTTAFAHSASVGTYLSGVHVPVFLSQGQDDTLFTLREAATTYLALKKQGNPVKMLWQQWGHSGGPVTGETDATSPVPVLFDDLRYSAWFAHYLRGDAAATTGPEFEYYTPWLHSNGVADTAGKADGTADTAQMSGAPSYPVGSPETLYLSGGTASGTGSLVGTAAAVVPGTASFLVSPASASSVSEISEFSQTVPIVDTPGTFAAFSTPPLTADADQVGSPTLTVNLSAPTFAATQATPAGQLELVAKLYDVAPDGTITLANRLVAPTRVPDVTKPVTIQLPAVVHRYPAGDHLELVLASSDAAYNSNRSAGPVQVVTDAAHVNTLSVPLTSAAAAAAGSAAAPGRTSAHPAARHPAARHPAARRPATRALRSVRQPSSTLAYTGGSALPALGGLALVGAATALARRRRRAVR